MFRLKQVEAELANLAANLAAGVVSLFGKKVAALQESFDGDSVRAEAAELIGELIESVTIYPDGADGPEAEVVSKVANLAAFALNDGAALFWGGVSSSMVLVAGVGFEPTTFRL